MPAIAGPAVSIARSGTFVMNLLAGDWPGKRVIPTGRTANPRIYPG
jgi:hypothetical protein